MIDQSYQMTGEVDNIDYLVTMETVSRWAILGMLVRSLLATCSVNGCYSRDGLA